MLTDPVADMLARIRNANKALHESAEMPTSRLKQEIARILKEEGYISDYHVKKGESFDTLVIQLKYGRSRERIITDLKRVSKPGRRVYAGKDRLPRRAPGRRPPPRRRLLPSRRHEGAAGHQLRGAGADADRREGRRQAAGR